MDTKFYEFKRQNGTYLKVFSKEGNFFRGETFHAERYVKEELIESFEVKEKIIGNFCNLYKNMFYLANRNPHFISKVFLLERLESFIQSELYIKMLSYFMGGLHIHFYDNVKGFNLTSNHDQFSLIAEGDKCKVSFKERDFFSYKFLENGKRINTFISREEAELFLSVIGLKFFYDKNYKPALLANKVRKNYISERDSLYITSLTYEEFKWGKSHGYEVIKRYIDGYYK